MLRSICTLLCVFGVASSTRYHLSFSAKSLFSRQQSSAITESSPYLKIAYVKGQTITAANLITTTKPIQKNLSPCWSEKFLVPNYKPEIRVDLRFEFWDASQGPHKCLGFVETSLQEFTEKVKDGEATVTIDVLMPDDLSQIQTGLYRSNDPKFVVNVNEVNEDEVDIHLQITGQALRKRDINGRSDPYLQIFLPDSTGAEYSKAPYYTTEQIKNDLNPKWNVFKLTAAGLLGFKKNVTRKIKFEVWDWDLTGSPTDPNRFIGRCEISYEDLLTQATTYAAGATLTLLSDKTKKKSGTLKVRMYESKSMEASYSVGKFVLHPRVAIDFTEKGNRSHPISLHHFLPGPENSDKISNKFTDAIKRSVSVLTEFESLQHYNVYGFGASQPDSGTPSEPAPISQPTPKSQPVPKSQSAPISKTAPGSQRKPDAKVSEPSVRLPFFVKTVKDVSEIIKAYQTILPQVSLQVPCYIAPVIRRAREKMATYGENEYGVLIILTQGIIDDFTETKAEIGEAAKLRKMTIIFIGVGNGDFTHIEGLHANKPAITVAGKALEPEIVQFVETNKFIAGLTSDIHDDKVKAEYLFKKAILKELLIEVRKREEKRLFKFYGFRE